MFARRAIWLLFAWVLLALGGTQVLACGPEGAHGACAALCPCCSGDAGEPLPGTAGQDDPALAGMASAPSARRVDIGPGRPPCVPGCRCNPTFPDSPPASFTSRGVVDAAAPAQGFARAVLTAFAHPPIPKLPDPAPHWRRLARLGVRTL